MSFYSSHHPQEVLLAQFRERWPKTPFISFYNECICPTLHSHIFGDQNIEIELNHKAVNYHQFVLFVLI